MSKQPSVIESMNWVDYCDSLSEEFFKRLYGSHQLPTDVARVLPLNGAPAAEESAAPAVVR